MGDQAALPDYRLLRVLGSGAWSRVYEARDPDDRPATVKILDAGYGGRHTRALDYERSLRCVEHLDHPNIVPIESWGRTLDDRLYTVMPYDGGAHDLRALVRPGAALPADHVADMARQILDGLYHLHRHGVVHGDVKPSNCLLHPDPLAPRVELIDFTATRYTGKAKLILDDDREVIGTPSYMAPERDDRVLGAVSDLYGAGVVLFELLTGELPYRAQTKASLRRMHKRLPIPRARRRVASLPSAVDEFFLQALAKTPEQRFDDARDMAESFARALTR